MPPFPLPLYPTAQTHLSSRQRRCLSPVQSSAAVKSNNSDFNSSSNSKQQWECAETSALTRVNHMSENMKVLRADAECTTSIIDKGKDNFKSDFAKQNNVAAQTHKTQTSTSHCEITSSHKSNKKKSKLINAKLSVMPLDKNEESLFTIKQRPVKKRAPLPLCSHEHDDGNSSMNKEYNDYNKLHENTQNEKDSLDHDDDEEGVVFTNVQCTEQQYSNNEINMIEYDEDEDYDNCNNGVITEELLRDWTGWEDLPLVLTAEFHLDSSQWINLDVLSSLLPMLNSLKLNRSYLPSIRVLGNGFQHLRYLWLNSCQLSDLHGISACAPHLVELYVAFNHITNIAPLLDIAETLCVLDVEGNELNNVHELTFVLGALGKVTSINLQGNPVEFDVNIAELLEARKQEMKLIQEEEEQTARLEEQPEQHEEIKSASEGNVKSTNNVHDNNLNNDATEKHVSLHKELNVKTENLLFEESEEELETIESGILCNSRVALFRQWIHIIMPQLKYLDDIPLPSLHSPTSTVQELQQEEESEEGESYANHHKISHHHHHHHHRHHHHHKYNNNSSSNENDDTNCLVDEVTSNTISVSSKSKVKSKMKKKKAHHHSLDGANTAKDVSNSNDDIEHHTSCKDETKVKIKESSTKAQNNKANKQLSAHLYSDPLDEALADELELVQACIRECKFDVLDAAIEARHKTLYSRPSTSCCGARPRKLSAYNNNNNDNNNNNTLSERRTNSGIGSKYTFLHTASSINMSGRLNNFCYNNDSRNKTNNDNNAVSKTESTRINTELKVQGVIATPVSRLTTGDVLAGSAIASLRKRLAEYKPVEVNTKKVPDISDSTKTNNDVNVKGENVIEDKPNNDNNNNAIRNKVETTEREGITKSVSEKESEYRDVEETKCEEFDENVEDEWDYYKAKLIRQGSASARPFSAFRERMLLQSDNQKLKEKKNEESCNVDCMVAAQNTNADKDIHQNKSNINNSNECTYENDCTCDSMTYDEASCRETISAPSTTPNSTATTLCASYTANSTWRMGTPSSEYPYSCMANSIKSIKNDDDMLFELHSVDNPEVHTNICTSDNCSNSHHNHHYYYFSDNVKSDIYTTKSNSNNHLHDDFNEFVKKQVQQTRAQIALAGEQEMLEIDDNNDNDDSSNSREVQCESEKRRQQMNKSSKSKSYVKDEHIDNNSVLRSGFLSKQGQFEVITLDDIP